MNDKHFLSSQHPHSKRWAVLEDDGTSAWLYLTKPDTEEPVSDVFAYNRIPPITVEEVQNYRNGPPPIPIGYAKFQAHLAHPDKSDFQIQWSRDGQSVAVLHDEMPLCCIIQAEHKGYNINLIAVSPWGQAWDQKRFDKTFPSDPVASSGRAPNPFAQFDKQTTAKPSRSAVWKFWKK